MTIHVIIIYKYLLTTLYIIVIGLLTEYATVSITSTSGDIIYLINESNITVWPGR